MLKLKKQEVKDLIDSGVKSIDYLLNRLKETNGLTKQDYEMLGHLDDIIIEYEDLHTNYLYLDAGYNKMRLKYKKIKEGI